jgi:membrane protease YdiL (CAAX protease family)
MVTLACILVYYGVLSTRVNEYITEHILRRDRRLNYHSRIERTAITRLCVAGLLQLCFFLLLALFNDITTQQLVGSDWGHTLSLVPYGMCLGLGEAALSSFVCYVVIKVAVVYSSRTGPQAEAGWTTMSKGGWMRSFLKTVEVTPIPVAIGVTALYVGVEEAVFRGVVMTAMRPWGAGYAFVASVLLFIMAQVFNMPSWRTALFPVIGATIVGVTHAAVYLKVPNVVPLASAHLILFMAAATILGPPPQMRQRIMRERFW